MESENMLQLLLAEGLGAEPFLCTLEEVMFTEAEQTRKKKTN
jgi:hypothetical protein